MISLCYVSAATQHMTNSELVQCLEQFRKNNTLINVTGLLLYNGHGTFLQVLEGDEEVVEELYRHINADPRHQRINCLGRRAITQRSFPDWSMGFKSLENEDLSMIDGYSDYLASDDAIQYMNSHHSFAFALLSHFKQATAKYQS